MKKPTIKECFEYSGNMEQSTLFFHYFDSQGWRVGKNPMKNWKSALTGWIKRSKSKTKVEKAISNEGQAVVDKFWVRMTQAFGNKWVSNYGEKPSKPWIDLISSMPHQKIAHGLQEMVKSGEDWPPSLVKFYQLCNSYRPKLLAIGGMSRNETLALRNETKQARLTAMNKIKGLL